MCFCSMVFPIIFPIYKTTNYIEMWLKSIFDQNIGHDKLEIILINDGSSDNSEQIVRESSTGRQDVEIFAQANKGLGGARNTGVDRALGEYVIFLDADDYIEENCLSLFITK